MIEQIVRVICDTIHYPYLTMSIISILRTLLSAAVFMSIVSMYSFFGRNDGLPAIYDTALSDEVSVNGIPYRTRVHWMRRANEALLDVTKTPCPFQAFGTAIVNHTDANGLGQLICIGANGNVQQGNPTLHGITSFFLSFFFLSSILSTSPSLYVSLSHTKAKSQPSTTARLYCRTYMG